MSSEKKYLCEDHKTKELIFMCMPCKKLICNRCKKAEHEGHKTRDIAKVAEEVRMQSEAKRNELVERTKQVEHKLSKHQERLEDYDLSVKHAKYELRQRGQILKEWIDQHIQKKMGVVDRFAAKHGRREIIEDIRKMETVLKSLTDQVRASDTILKDDTSDHDVAKLSMTMETPAPLTNPSAFFQMLNEYSPYKSHIVLQDTSFVKWRLCLRDYFGGPQLAQTTHKSALAIVLKLTCSDNAEARVLGLRAMGDGAVIVVVTTDDPNKGRLKLYRENGTVAHEEDIPAPTSCKLLISSGKLHALCTLTGTVTVLDSAPVVQFLSLFPENQSHKNQERMYVFKEDPSKRHSKKKKSGVSGKKEQHKVYEVIGTTLKYVFSIQADDPRTIVADPTGTVFAVIQEPFSETETVVVPSGIGKSTFFDTTLKCDSTIGDQSTSPSVVFYKRPDSQGSSGNISFKKLVTLSGTGCRPADACFYTFDLKQTVLVIADAGKSSLVKINFDGEEAAASFEILETMVCDCPLLNDPTALTTDQKGRLLIGCKGGVILTLLPKEEIIEGEYLVPKDVVEADYSSYEDGDGDATDDDSSSHTRETPNQTYYYSQPIETMTTRGSSDPGSAGSTVSSGLKQEDRDSGISADSAERRSTSQCVKSATAAVDDKKDTKEQTNAMAAAAAVSPPPVLPPRTRRSTSSSQPSTPLSQGRRFSEDKTTARSSDQLPSPHSDSLPAPPDSTQLGSPKDAPHSKAGKDAPEDAAKDEQTEHHGEQKEKEKPDIPPKPLKPPALLDRMKMFEK